MDFVIAIFIIAIVNILECHGGILENTLLRILRRNLKYEEEPNEYVYRRSLDDDEEPNEYFYRRSLNNDEEPNEYVYRRSLNNDEEPNEYVYRRSLNNDEEPNEYVYRRSLNNDEEPNEYVYRRSLNNDEEPNEYVYRRSLNNDEEPNEYVYRRSLNNDEEPNEYVYRRSLNNDEEPNEYVYRRSLNDDEEANEYIYRRNLKDDEEPNEYSYKGIGYDENSIEYDMNTRRLANLEESDEYLSRRFYDFHPGMGSTIIGAPTSPNQLPEAEAILPGHTLLRPALGMLKSAVKFPHKDLDDGAGVYGNFDNLGITYDGTGERVLYTGFRRLNDFIPNRRPRYLIALLRKPKRPSLRYKDYYKIELERQKQRENEKREKLNKIVYKDNVMKVIDNQDSDYRVKYEFLESPRLRDKAEREELTRYPKGSQHKGEHYSYNYDGIRPFMGEEDRIRFKAQDTKPKKVHNNEYSNPYKNNNAVRPTSHNNEYSDPYKNNHAVRPTSHNNEYSDPYKNNAVRPTMQSQKKRGGKKYRIAHTYPGEKIIPPVPYPGETQIPPVPYPGETKNTDTPSNDYAPVYGKRHKYRVLADRDYTRQQKIRRRKKRYYKNMF